jgi:hypothetical protein
MRGFRLVFLFFTFILASGCINENFEETFSKTEFAPEYSVPLGKTDFLLDTAFSLPGYFPPPEYKVVFFNDIKYNVPNSIERPSKAEQLNINYSKEIRNNIISMSFHLLIENNFPTNVITQIYFLDKSFAVVDSLSNTGPITIKSGIINDKGRVINGSIQIVDLPFGAEKIDRVTNAVYFNIKNTIQTYNSNIDTVRFYTENNISITSGLRIKLKVKINEL